MTEPAPALDKVIIMLVSGIGRKDAEGACVEKLGMTDAEAADAIEQALRKITITADYDRDTEVGTAHIRINDLYRRALLVQDVKTALVAQRELNKLLDLYRTDTAMTEADGAAAEQDDSAREHLEALGLGTPADTTTELARLAVAEILRLRQHANSNQDIET